MPRASSICLQRDCLKVATLRGRCASHAPPPWAGSKRNAERPTNWNWLRRTVRLRDKSTCRLCGNPGNIVDHIINIARGGDWTLKNLQVLCKPCSDAKTKGESRGR